MGALFLFLAGGCGVLSPIATLCNRTNLSPLLSGQKWQNPPGVPRQSLVTFHCWKVTNKRHPLVRPGRTTKNHIHEVHEGRGGSRQSLVPFHCWKGTSKNRPMPWPWRTTAKLFDTQKAHPMWDAPFAYIRFRAASPEWTALAGPFPPPDRGRRSSARWRFAPWGRR